MRILGIIIFKFILGYILQGFACVLGIYAFSFQKIVMKKFIFMSAIYSSILFLSRLLPVNIGIYTIIDMIFLFLLSVLFLRLPLLSTIKSIPIITALILLTELLSVLLMTSIFGIEKINVMMTDSLGKSIIALPSSVIFALLVVLSYFILRNSKNKRFKNGAHSKQII